MSATETGAEVTKSASGQSGQPGQSGQSGFWKALAVRPGEVEQIRRLILCSTLVGFALVFFFSGSNALFLERVGADSLPWVYIANAPLVIAAGLGYAFWSRRSSTATVLRGSIWLLTASVAALWLWASTTDGGTASFALAVWFRFLFIFGFLGLWEIASAAFDVRQAKRLFPAVALGAMVAFVIGGVVITGLTAVIGTVHLIAISACFFALYGLAFARAMEGADFEAADESTPATPREIVADRFSRNLAIMRSITILLIFVTEFVFYEQVAANFSSDASIARFLGVFMAVATLTMVICTALVSAKYISRYGVGVGLATMPVGVLVMAVLLGIYGSVIGINFGFFALAVLANLVNMVLANAIETPVGAVMYQPMPVERRMPVRVAVDGWLGSVAVLGAGLLLLAFDRFGFDDVRPFVWLLAAIGLVGVVIARRLYADYRQALAEATVVAFSSSSQGGPGVAADGSSTGSAAGSTAVSTTLLAELNEGRGRLQAGLTADDPAAAFAIAALAQDLDDDPLALILPDLADSDDPEVARLAIAALVDSGDQAHHGRLASIAVDQLRPEPVRASALAGLATLDAAEAEAAAATIRRSDSQRLDRVEAHELAVQVHAIAATANPNGPEVDELIGRARSETAADRRFAAQVLAAARPDATLSEPLRDVLAELIDDRDDAVRAIALEAARQRVDPELGRRLVAVGNHPQHRRRAVEALSTGGSESVEMLDGVIGDLPESYVVDLVDHVYAPNTRRPVVLHRFLEPNATSPMRRAGFDASRRADVNLPATITRLLRDDVDFARGLLGAWRDAVQLDEDLTQPLAADADGNLVQADGDSTLPLVADVLSNEFEAARRAIWAGLRLAADATRVGEIELLIRRSDEDTRANAIEALDNLLPTATRQLVIAVLEPTNIAEAAEVVSGLPPQQERRSALVELRDNPRTMQSTRELLDHYLESGQKVETDDMSQTIERVIALKRVDIFSTLPYEILAELAQVATRREAHAGTEIIVEGDFGDELFALVAGEVRVERSGGTATVLSAGTVFGELAVLDPGPRSATVLAEVDCELLVVDRPMLLALTDRRPDVMSEIARVLSIRLRNTD